MSAELTATNQVRTLLAQRRQSAQVTLDLHQQEIAAAIPQIAELRERLADTGAQLCRLVLAKPNDLATAVERLKQENLSIQQQITDLLVANGYPADYLKIKYSCPTCEDTGYINGKPCTCFTQLLKQISTEQLNHRSPLQLSDFDGFDLSYYADSMQGSVIPREQMKKIYQYCMGYAKNFRVDSPSLLFYGNTGLGKTHLSMSIANAVLAQGYSVIYGSAQDLFRQVEKEHFGRADSTQDTIGNLLGCDLLILDDLGAEFDSGYYTACLYNIINTRCNLQKPTIVSTNLTPSELKQRYPDRIVSRLLAGYQHLQFVGKDIRQLKMTRK